MKNALIIHGCCDKEEYYSDVYPSLTNSHWFPWLQKQLLVKNIFTQTPEMPEAFNPDYKKWKAEFERFDVNKESVLVGHSCGGGFLLRWLSENKISIEKLILVAPFLNPNKKERYGDGFLDFKIDPEIIERTNSIEVLLSDNEDVDGVKESVDTIMKTFPSATLHQFKNMGHFTYGAMGLWG